MKNDSKLQAIAPAPWSSSSSSTQARFERSTYSPAPPTSFVASQPAPQAQLWRGESEAWRRKQEMEEEIRRRALTASQPQPVPSFKVGFLVFEKSVLCI